MNRRGFRFATTIAAAALATDAASALATECEVRGERLVLEKIAVRSSNGDKFDVRVSDVPAVVSIRAARGPARVQIGGVLAFSGTASNVWYKVASDVVTSDGMVRAAAGASFLARQASGGDVVGALVIEEGDVIEGEQKQPAEWVEGVRVPCDRLGLDRPDDQSADGPDEQRPVGKVWLTRRGPRLVLRARPGGGPTVTLGRPDCTGPHCLAVIGTSARGPWVKVATSTPWVRVEGWARRAELERTADDEIARASMCTGDHGGGLEGRRVRTDPGGVYEGPAQVLAGTPVHADDGGRWAEVTRDASFKVRFARGADTVELLEIPGIHAPFAGAFVPADRVVFPPEAGVTR